jgi:DNA-binding beta-propeller fold protein YncE
MRILILAVVALLSTQAPAQHSLEKIWETQPVLKFPEALVMEPGGQFLYVTNTDGNPLEKDGKGSIGKVGLDGTVIAVDWVTGLDAPKGLAQHDDLLYAADLAQVVVVDTKQAAIVRRIPVAGANLLHNVAVDSAGAVYVSDLFAGKVFKIEGTTVSTYVENLRSPAGIVVAGRDLYVFTGDGLVKIDLAKTVTTVSRNMDGRANGLVMVNDREFIATSWGGVAYYVNADGSNQVLLDTTADRIAAGINLYDLKTRTMYMTTDEHNVVMAFRVK